MGTPKLIQCGDHKWAPWCVVCKRLLREETKEYVRLPAIPGAQDDFVCSTCFSVGLDNLDADDLAAVCIHCAREVINGMQEAPMPK